MNNARFLVRLNSFVMNYKNAKKKDRTIVNFNLMRSTFIATSFSKEKRHYSNVGSKVGFSRKTSGR